MLYYDTFKKIQKNEHFCINFVIPLKSANMTFIQKVLHEYVEKSSFGVCRYLAGKTGLDESRVRMYFIYSSFAAFGSPVIFYLAAAFWMNIRKCFRPAQII